MKTSLTTHLLVASLAIIFTWLICQVPQKTTLVAELTTKLTSDITTRSTSKENTDFVSVVAAEKMNVLYVGLENPISIATPNTPVENLKITLQPSAYASLGRTENPYQYTVFIREGGLQKIKVVVEDVNNKNNRQEHIFRIKRVPTPEARLPIGPAGLIKKGQIRACKGKNLQLDHPCFQYDQACKLESYTFRYTPRKEAAIEVEVNNPGEHFPPKVDSLLMQSRPGGRYEFVDIQARCPGDRYNQKLENAVYYIK